MHWPIFEDKKGESVEKGDVNFYKKSCFDEKCAQKGNGEHTSEYNI